MQIPRQAPAEVQQPHAQGHVKVAFSIPEAVAATGLSRSYLYEAIKHGELIARKAGARTVIAADDLSAYIARLPRAD